MLGILGLVARGAITAARGGATATKAPIQTIARPTGWGKYAKTGIVGGSVAAGGLGLSSAIGSAQESITQGGGGLLMVGGVIVAIILILFLVLRR